MISKNWPNFPTKVAKLVKFALKIIIIIIKFPKDYVRETTLKFVPNTIYNH